MLLSACSSNYQALESGSISGGGYQERLLSETEFSLFESNEPELGTPEQPVRYWLLYQGTNFDTQARIHIFWQQRAQEFFMNTAVTVIKLSNINSVLNTAQCAHLLMAVCKP